MRRYLTNPDHALDVLVFVLMVTVTLGILCLLGLVHHV